MILHDIDSDNIIKCNIVVAVKLSLLKEISIYEYKESVCNNINNSIITLTKFVLWG